MQGGDHGHRAKLHRVQGLVPHARVHHPLPGVALLQLRQIQAGAEVIARAVDHGGFGGLGQGLEHVAQRDDQAVVQGIAFQRPRQGHHGHIPLHVQVQVGVAVSFHGCSPGVRRLLFITI